MVFAFETQRPGSGPPDWRVFLGHALNLTCFVVGTGQGIGNYVRAALNLGLSEAPVKELFFHLNFCAGLPQSGGVTAIAKEVLKSN